MMAVETSYPDTTCSMRRSISVGQFVEEPRSSDFFANLCREQGVTDINFVSDNAKPTASLPRSVFLQSSNDEENKSESRWESIPRVHSAGALDNMYRNRRKSHSLSPTPLIKNRNWQPSKKFEQSLSSLTDKKSELPLVLQNNILQLFGTDSTSTTGEEKLNEVESLVRDSNSNSPLQMPQRKAFINSGPSKQRRRGRKPSKFISLDQCYNDIAKYSNGTLSTRDMTPSPKTPAEAAAKILKLSSNSIETPAPPLITPTVSRKARQRPLKSPPHHRSGTPPPLSRAQRRSRDSIYRPNTPPPPGLGTPPSVKRGVRTRRHSDGILNVDLKVSETLLHLAQISSAPVQPVRRRSYDSMDLGASNTSFESLLSDQAEEVLPPMVSIHKQASNEDGDASSSDDNTTIETSDNKQNHDGLRSPSKVRFADQVNCSPPTSSSPKKSTRQRVRSTPRRQRSAPLTSMASSRQGNEKETELLASFERLKPFEPRRFVPLKVSKTGAISSSAQKTAARTSNNRDIVRASFQVHRVNSSDSIDLLDFSPGLSSSGKLEVPSSMVDLLAAPSLDTPPSSRRGKKKKKFASVPPDVMIPHLTGESTKH